MTGIRASAAPARAFAGCRSLLFRCHMASSTTCTDREPEARRRPPRLLDLFCGAGGAAVGYHRAGFEVVGVDHKRQPRYPFTFIQADALETLKSIGDRFDAIHASPPCQAYTTAS